MARRQFENPITLLRSSKSTNKSTNETNTNTFSKMDRRRVTPLPWGLPEPQQTQDEVFTFSDDHYKTPNYPRPFGYDNEKECIHYDTGLIHHDKTDTNITPFLSTTHLPTKMTEFFAPYAAVTMPAATTGAAQHHHQHYKNNLDLLLLAAEHHAKTTFDNKNTTTTPSPRRVSILGHDVPSSMTNWHWYNKDDNTTDAATTTNATMSSSLLDTSTTVSAPQPMHAWDWHDSTVHESFNDNGSNDNDDDQDEGEQDDDDGDDEETILVIRNARILCTIYQTPTGEWEDYNSNDDDDDDDDDSVTSSSSGSSNSSDNGNDNQEPSNAITMAAAAAPYRKCFETLAQELKAFHRRYGHARVAQKKGSPYCALGKWIANNRSKYKHEGISADRLAFFQSMGCDGFGRDHEHCTTSKKKDENHDQGTLVVPTTTTTTTTTTTSRTRNKRRLQLTYTTTVQNVNNKKKKGSIVASADKINTKPEAAAPNNQSNKKVTSTAKAKNANRPNNNNSKNKQTFNKDKQECAIVATSSTTTTTTSSSSSKGNNTNNISKTNNKSSSNNKCQSSTMPLTDSPASVYSTRTSTTWGRGHRTAKQIHIAVVVKKERVATITATSHSSTTKSSSTSCSSNSKTISRSSSSSCASSSSSSWSKNGRCKPRTEWYTWEERMTQLQDHLDLMGHNDVSTAKTNNPHKELGQWLAANRTLYKYGKLTDRNRLRDLRRMKCTRFGGKV